MTGKDAGQMKAFMQTLNRTERLILLLFYADQLSQMEIGLVLDLPESRVSSMLGTLQRQAAAAIKCEGSLGSAGAGGTGGVRVSQAVS